jgi:prepilin-type N-terminal cleavage/methylation domain-containing protein
MSLGRASFSPFSRRAFTLVELVTAMAICGILLTAIASALSFSIKTSTGQGAVNQTNLLTAGDSADQIADDLHVAMSFSERTGTSVAFTVPDRVNNGTPNQVRYAWDGISGDPLTRQFSAANTPILTASATTPTTLLSGVSNFDLNYLTRLMGTAAVTPSVLAPNGTAVGTFGTFNIDSTHWACEYFTPVVPLGTTSYTITSAQIKIKTGAAQDGILSIGIASANLFKQPATYLEQEPLYESATSTNNEYVSVTFKNLKNLNILSYPALCLVIRYTSGTTPVATLQYQSSLSNIHMGADWSTTSNGGASWPAASPVLCLLFNVYGTTP